MSTNRQRTTKRLSAACGRCDDLSTLYEQVEKIQKLIVVTSSKYIRNDAEILKEIGISMIERLENDLCKCELQLMIEFPV